MDIIAVLRVILQYLHDIFDLFVRLLLVKWPVGGLLSDHLGRISEDQEKGQSTLVLNRLEKGAELSVFVDLVLKSEAVSISREDVELFILPIVEKLEELYKLLASFFVFRFLKSEYGMISGQAIWDAPDGIYIPEVTFFDSFQVFIFDVSSKLVNHFVDNFQVRSLPDDVVDGQHQRKVREGAHAKLKLLVVAINTISIQLIDFFKNLPGEESRGTLKSDTLILTAIL
jgi:hypothetical protein